MTSATARGLGYEPANTMIKTIAIALSATVLLITGTVPQRQEQLFFDDFSYKNTEAMKKNRWIIRTEPGACIG